MQLHPAKSQRIGFAESLGLSWQSLGRRPTGSSGRLTCGSAAQPSQGKYDHGSGESSGPQVMSFAVPSKTPGICSPWQERARA